MEYLPRNFDVLDGSGDLEHLHTFTNFPVYMGVESQLRDDDLLADMRWVISRSTGVIQLDPTLPLEIVYARSHGSGSVGGLWDHHHQSFASFVARQDPLRVLEIGGGHGKLASNVARMKDVDWVIVEPNPSADETCPAMVIDAFFSPSLAIGLNFDTIVHSHVLEHIYEPASFCRDLATVLNEGGQVIVSVPNMTEMLRRGYTNCLNFEHTYFLREEYLYWLMGQAGFDLVDQEYFRDDHSIFCCFRRTRGELGYREPPDMYNENKRLFQTFVGEHTAFVDALNLQLNKISSPKFFFGAHIFAQYLFKFGLNESEFVHLLDNDQKKWGKRLSGGSLIVESPEALRGILNPTVVLKAGAYNDEIREQILTLVNPTTTFLD